MFFWLTEEGYKGLGVSFNFFVFTLLKKKRLRGLPKRLESTNLPIH